MLNFFDWIIDAFSMIFEIVAGLIGGLINFIVMILSSISFIGVLVPTLPSILSLSCMVIIVAAVVKTILGR